MLGYTIFSDTTKNLPIAIGRYMKKFGFLIGILLIAVTLTACPPTQAASETLTFVANLDGASEVTTTGNASQATGSVTAVLKDGKLTVDGTYTGLAGAPTGAHIHGPAAANANANVVFPLTTTEGAAPTAGKLSGTFDISASQIAELKDGMYYVNVHTAKYASGEIRGQLTKKQ